MKFGRICSTILIACFLASNLTACGPSAKEAAWMQKMSDLYSDDSFTLVGEPEDDSTFTEGNSIELKSAKYPAYQIIVGSANELSLDAKRGKNLQSTQVQSRHHFSAIMNPLFMRKISVNMTVNCWKACIRKMILR